MNASLPERFNECLHSATYHHGNHHAVTTTVLWYGDRLGRMGLTIQNNNSTSTLPTVPNTLYYNVLPLHTCVALLTSLSYLDFYSGASSLLNQALVVSPCARAWRGLVALEDGGKRRCDDR